MTSPDTPAPLADLIAESGLPAHILLRYMATHGLTSQACTALARSGIYTVGDLDGRTDADMLTLPGVSTGRLAMLRAAIVSLGEQRRAAR